MYGFSGQIVYSKIEHPWIINKIVRIEAMNNQFLLLIFVKLIFTNFFKARQI